MNDRRPDKEGAERGMPDSTARAILASVAGRKDRSVDHAELRSLVINVSNQHLAAIGSSVALARHGIARVDAVAGQIEATGQAQVAAVEKLEWHLSAARDTLARMDARFDWHMSELLGVAGAMSDSLTRLVDLAATPAQTAAYEQFEIARDAFRRRLFPEALAALKRATGGDERHSGYPLEWRFHMLEGVIRLGEVPDVDGDSQDRPAARAAFLLAARYAEAAEPIEAAQALLGAARAAFIEHHLEDAVESARRAATLAPQLAETHYRTAKYLAERDGFDASRPALTAAVVEDPEYLVKIAADADLSRHAEALGEFLASLRQDRLADVRAATEPAAERASVWLDRSADLRDSAIWQRWSELRGGAEAWGYLDLHHYRLDQLDADLAEMGALVGRLERVDRGVRAALDELGAGIARYGEVAELTAVAAWRAQQGERGVSASYADDLERDVAAVRVHIAELEALEADVSAAFDRFQPLVPRTKALADHPVLNRWRKLITDGGWQRNYSERFTTDLAQL